MLNQLKQGVLCASLLFGLNAAAEAALTYSIDPTLHTITINGTAHGVPGASETADPENALLGEIRWRTIGWQGTENGDQTDTQEQSLSGTIGLGGGDNGFVRFGFEAVHLLNLHYIAFSVWSFNQDTTTITFEDLTLDYSLFSLSNRNYIDSLANRPDSQRTLNLSVGSGYGPITYSAVPEASHVAVLMGLGAAGVLLARRRSAAKCG